MDAESFKKAYLPYHRKLYHIAYQLLENEADAKDLVQEAYLKLWDKRDGLSVISNPEAFCVTLIKNMCLDMLRSSKYIAGKQMEELDVSHAISLADELETHDDARHIRSLIARLPEQQQQIVVLRDIKEYTYEEIEQITGLTAVNIRVLLSRARKKIREQFIKISTYESRSN